MVGSGYCTPDTSVEIEMVIFIWMQTCPTSVIVVSGRGTWA